MSDEKALGCLALDVGGANIKAAHSRGDTASASFALWKDPGRLTAELRVLGHRLPQAHEIRLTMTAELCDCFPTKADGVRHVVRAVQCWSGDRALWVWGNDGRFHSAATIEADPALAAASNWLALATALARRAQSAAGLLIDIGSTTADLIPFEDGRVLEVGRTDTERLKTGALVYAGVRRTPLCALTNTIELGEASIGVAAELFATTLDVYLMLGDIEEDASDHDTADSQPATRNGAQSRLCRMVCADPTELSDTDVMGLAEAFHRSLLRRLVLHAGNLLRRLTREVDLVVVSGSGEFLARRVADSVMSTQTRILSLRNEWGADATIAACARALLELEPTGS
ncbi:MAG: hydantoinase/oxoprolinase family protein [Isosphaeraceae bacterium]